jgi:glycogen operon protein
MHPSSGVTHRGTFLGLVEKIPYLLDLGVTSVELLPVFEFDETDNPRKNPRTGERLWNFWGYAPVSFFAPKAAYAAEPLCGGAVSEFRLLVEELHRAGLEVILDVVYNHTGEHADCPVSWMGLDREAYYLFRESEPVLLDFTGCGHTFQVEHEVSKKMVLDSLRHWVRWYDVDGFRLDLAGAFFRGPSGERLERSSLVEAIGADPILEDRLWIAEPWDATGYLPEQGFPPPWRLWHGEFRDDVRRLVRGEAIPLERLATHFGAGRVIGSRKAELYVDFVACHDGFPVADLVQYARKHNEGNGEGNRDGSDWNFSANYGVEGPTKEPEILKVRNVQRRNLLILWAMASAHTLLFPAGDEGGRTQGGNNNPWCQDNEQSWMVWEALDPAKIRWFRELLRLRGRLLRTPWASVTTFAGFQEIKARQGDADPKAGKVAGFLWRDRKGQNRVFWAWNFCEHPCSFVLPPLTGDRRWVLRLDSTLPEPQGIQLMLRGARVGIAPAVVLPSRSVRLWLSQPGRRFGAGLQKG